VARANAESGRAYVVTHAPRQTAVHIGRSGQCVAMARATRSLLAAHAVNDMGRRHGRND
jgi:hypothetical protein